MRSSQALSIFLSSIYFFGVLPVAFSNTVVNLALLMLHIPAYSEMRRAFLYSASMRVTAVLILSRPDREWIVAVSFFCSDAVTSERRVRNRALIRTCEPFLFLANIILDRASVAILESDIAYIPLSEMPQRSSISGMA